MIQRKITLGPIHPWLPGAMKLNLDLYGDQIISAEPGFGFSGKAIESRMVGLPFEEAAFLFGRLEAESAFLLDRMYFEGIEEALAIPVAERAVWIRDVTSLISELSGLLKYLSAMANVLGLKVLRHVILKHREELLDLIELLSGSRYGYTYLVAGGTRYDLTEGFVERLDAWMRAYHRDFERIQALFLWTHPFQNRLRSLGRVMDDGKMGFVSEASVESTRYGVVSQVESRLTYALKESFDISGELLDLINQIKEGEHLTRVTRDEFSKVRQESVQVDLETSRGKWQMSLALDPYQKIQSIAVQSPSQQIQPAILMALEGEQFEDIAVILQSLNFKVTEIDR